MLLGVNIDHVATVREARRINEPDPLEAVFAAKAGGADQITLHLREDRRHIHDSDLRRIVQSCPLPVNLECALAPQMIALAAEIRPHRVTLVPEQREEVTTEGGLDVLGRKEAVLDALDALESVGIEVSLFVDPDLEVIEACHRMGVGMVELHTGSYANLHLMRYSNLQRTQHSLAALELSRCELTEALAQSEEALRAAAHAALRANLFVAAGHGLNYQNVRPIARMEAISELNIGHSLIARALFVGLERAVTEMRSLLS